MLRYLERGYLDPELTQSRGSDSDEKGSDAFSSGAEIEQTLSH
jgi:hypothetical protein